MYPSACPEIPIFNSAEGMGMWLVFYMYMCMYMYMHI